MRFLCSIFKKKQENVIKYQLLQSFIFYQSRLYNLNEAQHKKRIHFIYYHVYNIFV